LNGIIGAWSPDYQSLLQTLAMTECFLDFILAANIFLLLFSTICLKKSTNAGLSFEASDHSPAPSLA
jgi:hypothetical protein